MPEYNRFKPKSKDKSTNTKRNAANRTTRRNWLKKQTNYKINNSPLDNRV